MKMSSSRNVRTVVGLDIHVKMYLYVQEFTISNDFSETKFTLGITSKNLFLRKSIRT